MTLIQTVNPENAEGKAKEIYDTMKKTAGVVPAPLQLASASPRMLDMVWQSIQYYSQHPNLGFGLLSTIRYLVACKYDFAFCTGFNKNFLMMQGMSEEDIEKIEQVGNYALQFYFDDNHNTGIYSYETLYKFGTNYDELWQDYLRRLKEAGHEHKG